MNQEEIVVPKGWELKKLGDSDVSEIIMGQSPPSSTYNIQQNGLPFFQGKKDFGEKFPTARTWCNKPKKIAKKGDILISVRAPVGSTNWAKEECCIGRGLSAIRVKIEPEYVYYFSKSLEHKLSKSGTGSVFNSISKDFLFQIQIPVPDTSIQKQIVAKLDHILGELEVKKKEILSLIEQNKQRIDFFEKNWMSYVIDREIEKHPQRKEWELKKLGELGEYKYGYNGKTSSDKSGKPYLRITDINFDGSLKHTRVYVQISKDNFQKYSLQTNDIVIARTGATVGKSFLFTENEIFVFASYLIRYRFVQDKILPKFVSYLLKSSSFWSFIGLKQTVGAQPNVNATKMSQFEFRLPPLTIQKQIIQNIKSAEDKFQTQKKQFENIKNNYDSKINYINHIQSSVLDSAFSGKLVK